MSNVKLRDCICQDGDTQPCEFCRTTRQPLEPYVLAARTFEHKLPSRGGQRVIHREIEDDEDDVDSGNFIHPGIVMGHMHAN